MTRVWPALIALITLPVSANESDDTLQFYLSKSDLVIAATVASEPEGIVTEKGVVKYSVDVDVTNVIKGSVPAGKPLHVCVLRFESEKRDKLQLLKDGKECLLFLRGPDGEGIWKTTDFWFGIQRSSPSLVRSLKRLVGQSLIAVPAVAEIPAQTGVKPIDQLNDKGFSQLHIAAMSGDVKTVHRLLNEGANANVRQGTFLGTPLQYAAAGGHVEVIGELVKHRAEVDSRDSNGRTPLIWAVYRGQAQAVEMLLSADADLRATSNNGWTPLHHAYGNGHERIVRLLIERGAPQDVLDNAGITPARVGVPATNEKTTPEVKPRPPSESSRESSTDRKGPPEGGRIRVVGRLESTEYAQRAGSIERSIVSINRIPDGERIDDVLSPSTQFELMLPPGRYRLVFTANGSRGATFVPQTRELTVSADAARIDIGKVDLRLGRTARLYGQPAPEWDGIAAWKNTSPLSLKQLRGKVVLLDFFGYYCTICHAHKPDLLKLHDKYRDQGLQVVAIHDESLDNLVEFERKMDPILSKVLKDRASDLPLALDGKGAGNVFQSYGITAVPAVLLIDRQGRVFRRFHHAGVPEIEGEIEKLLNEKP